ncbi:MAG: Unknown protein, partial [uncultured Thiotrichaceae bacterium]
PDLIQKTPGTARHDDGQYPSEALSDSVVKHMTEAVNTRLNLLP